MSALSLVATATATAMDEERRPAAPAAGGDAASELRQSQAAFSLRVLPQDVDGKACSDLTLRRYAYWTTVAGPEEAAALEDQARGWLARLLKDPDHLQDLHKLTFARQLRNGHTALGVLRLLWPSTAPSPKAEAPEGAASSLTPFVDGCASIGLPVAVEASIRQQLRTDVVMCQSARAILHCVMELSRLAARQGLADPPPMIALEEPSLPSPRSVSTASLSESSSESPRPPLQSRSSSTVSVSELEPDSVGSASNRSSVSSESEAAEGLQLSAGPGPAGHARMHSEGFIASPDQPLHHTEAASVQLFSNFESVSITPTASHRPETRRSKWRSVSLTPGLRFHKAPASLGSEPSLDIGGALANSLDGPSPRQRGAHSARTKWRQIAIHPEPAPATLHPLPEPLDPAVCQAHAEPTAGPTHQQPISFVFEYPPFPGDPIDEAVAAAFARDKLRIRPVRLDQGLYLFSSANRVRRLSSPTPSPRGRHAKLTRANSFPRAFVFDAQPLSPKSLNAFPFPVTPTAERDSPIPEDRPVTVQAPVHLLSGCPLVHFEGLWLGLQLFVARFLDHVSVCASAAADAALSAAAAGAESKEAREPKELELGVGEEDVLALEDQLRECFLDTLVPQLAQLDARILTFSSEALFRKAIAEGVSCDQYDAFIERELQAVSASGSRSSSPAPTAKPTSALGSTEGASAGSANAAAQSAAGGAGKPATGSQIRVAVRRWLDRGQGQ